MLQPGDVVTVDFQGATGVKRRPCIVVSTAAYHTRRPDVVLTALTTQLASATTPTDYHLQDWKVANLNAPSAARVYLATHHASAVQVIGHLSDRDWQQVQSLLQIALAVT